MRTFKKNSLAVLAAFLTSMTFGSALSANVLNTDDKECKEVKPVESELLGSWEYSAENAPEQYKLGALSIFHENGENNVFVQLDEKEVFGKKVNLVGNTISFEIKLEGTVFKVKLTAKGEVLSGTYTYAEGTFEIKGARVKIM
ncbi:hypothetical protein [Zobellia laminariae]|uniref:hypothetical protein n=1 Tax=Zobellia laminariae TaxID=248906 RepID=UPI0026F47AAE|nr:hypothetical protein [Zobellia laminariae]WKX74826.1 hypothetical protein Q5W13_13560 [Zobellia laminariae]